jgi:hypothetical protein
LCPPKIKRKKNTNTNPKAVLLHPKAWECLNDTERQKVLSLWPDDNNILDAGTHDARPNAKSLMNDNNFHYDCARYLEDIQNGRHDEGWLEDGWAAHESRCAGEYDEYLNRKFENDWDVELPPKMKMRRKSKQPPSVNEGAVISSDDELLAAGDATARPTPDSTQRGAPQASPRRPSGSTDELARDPGDSMTNTSEIASKVEGG